MQVLRKVRHHLGVHTCLAKVVLHVTHNFKNTFSVRLNMLHLEPNMLTDMKL